MSRFLILFLAFFASASFAEIYDIDNDKLTAMMENQVPLVDIRTRKEWQATGIIPKSYLLTFFDTNGNFSTEEWLPKLAVIAGENDPVIIICRSGNRSYIVAKFLAQDADYKYVYHVKNGIISWIKSGNKTVHP